MLRKENSLKLDFDGIIVINHFHNSNYIRYTEPKMKAYDIDIDIFPLSLIQNVLSVFVITFIKKIFIKAKHALRFQVNF